MTELYHWFQGLTLPVPVYGAAGLLLALLSNANQWMPQFQAGSLPSKLSATHPKPTIKAGETQPQANPSQEVQPEEASLPPLLHSPQTPMSQPLPSEPQLPNLPVATPPSISFTIHKP